MSLPDPPIEEEPLKTTIEVEHKAEVLVKVARSAKDAKDHTSKQFNEFRFSKQEWDAFLVRAKAGEFD